MTAKKYEAPFRFQVTIDDFEVAAFGDVSASVTVEVEKAIYDGVKPIDGKIRFKSMSITTHQSKQSSMYEWMRKVLDEGRPTAELLESDRRKFIKSFPRRWRMTVSQWCAKHRAEMEAMWFLGGVEAWEVFDNNLTHQAMADKSRRAIHENKRDTMRKHSRRRGR